jgi:predicted nicotinamide N-methyase
VLSAYIGGYCLGNKACHVPQLSTLHKLLSKQNLQVLELGAGCGVVGITLKMCLSTANVLLTDLPEAEEISRHNILANWALPKKVHGNSARIQYQNLNWEDPLPEDQRSGDIDLVVVADCTYNPDVVPHLVKTLAEIQQYNKQVMILLALKVRHDSEIVFFDLMAEKHFVITDKLVLPLPLLGEEDEEIEIYLFTYDPKHNTAP